MRNHIFLEFMKADCIMDGCVRKLLSEIIIKDVMRKK